MAHLDLTLQKTDGALFARKIIHETFSENNIPNDNTKLLVFQDVEGGHELTTMNRVGI